MNERKKIKDSNIQIVSNILKLYNQKEIGVINIDLESENLLTEEECQNILDDFFNKYNFRDNYYQRIMLINFLAVQFKMFTECVSLNINLMQDDYNDINMISTIKNARPKIIEAIINSAILATSGPFDKLIEIENESFKENNNYNEININDNKSEDIDTINYESIKGCLFFFNKDKEFFTIITNNPSSEDYDLFLSLYTSQDINTNDFDINIKKQLINYGNLTHEEYIEELRKIFDIPSEVNIKEIAKKNGNYIFTRDNFIKMILIYFRRRQGVVKQVL